MYTHKLREIFPNFAITKGLFIWKPAGPLSEIVRGRRDEFVLCLYEKILSRCGDNFVVLTVVS